jgi:hypothetical protein
MQLAAAREIAVAQRWTQSTLAWAPSAAVPDYKRRPLAPPWAKPGAGPGLPPPARLLPGMEFETYIRYLSTGRQRNLV